MPEKPSKILVSKEVQTVDPVDYNLGVQIQIDPEMIANKVAQSIKKNNLD